MRRRLSSALLLALVLAPWPAAARDKESDDAFAATIPGPPPPPPANGAIFQGGYVPLTSGGRAGRVGDIVTIQLVERSEEHTSELQSLMRSSYAVFCLKKQKEENNKYSTDNRHETNT